MPSSPQNLHRSFFALIFPSSVNRAISDLIAELRRSDDDAVRWTSPQNLHLTLRFLGELVDEEFVAAREFLHSSSLGHSFRLRLADIDAFPSLRKPSIPVLTVEGSTPKDSEALLTLQKKTEEFARGLGLEPDDRPFRPHITLGRLKRNRPISPLLRTALTTATLKSIGEIEGDIESLLLMESMLKPEGPKYTVAAKAELG